MAEVFLIVDDEPLLIEAITFAVEECGYKALVADSVDTAIQHLSQSKVDAIISDIRMPKKSGKDLLIYVKAHFPTIPFIFMSGYSELDDKAAKDLGALGILSKPLDLKNMNATLQRILKSGT